MSIAASKPKAALVWGLVLQVPVVAYERQILCLDEKPPIGLEPRILPVNLLFLSRFIGEALVYKVLCDYVTDFTKAAVPLKTSLTKSAAHTLRVGLFESALSPTPERTMELAKIAALEDFPWRVQRLRKEAMEMLGEVLMPDLRRFGELDEAMRKALVPPLDTYKAGLQLPVAEVEKKSSLVGSLLGRKSSEPEATVALSPYEVFKRQFWSGMLEILKLRQSTGAYQSSSLRIAVGRQECELIRQPLLDAFKEFAGEAAIALP